MDELAVIGAAIQFPSWLPFALIVVAIGGGLYVVLPELKNWAKTPRTAIVPDATQPATKIITESIDVNKPCQATFLAMWKAFESGQYEVARKLLEAAIEQKGPVNA